MLERLKQKKLGKKGFTLAELLIVVAIIAVLVAIAIPTFSGAMEKAEKATDDANIRAAYAEHQVGQIDSTLLNPPSDVTPGVTGTTITFADGGTYTLKYYASVDQTANPWKGVPKTS